MKTLRTNLLGKKYLEQYPKITIKTLFKEIEKQVRLEVTKQKIDGVNLVYTKGNYGGYRKWFQCPICYKKRLSLYNVGGKFKCRKCLGLPYKSQKFNGMLEEKVYKRK